MLIATWILAVSTGILAIGGPIAFATYLADRKAKREQEARDRVLREAADRFLTKADASEKFIAKDDAAQKFLSRDTAVGVTVLTLLVGALGVSSWLEGRKPKG